MGMNSSLRIAENIVFLRKNKGITQDELASFLGVTKASVSKWENGQSMPDILLLPEIATFFDVTVDWILGYEPQLSKEQIQKIYHELGEEFAAKPFEEVFAKSEAMVKKYFSCYLFLLQICILWMNHFMLAEGKERQEEILNQLLELCNHILENCKNNEIYSDTLGVKAYVDLLCGRAQDTIEGISKLLSPNRVLNQSDSLLIKAYLMENEVENADRFTQASIYLHLLMLINDSTCFISMHMQEKALCEKTIVRIDAVIKEYQIQKLNPSVVGGYFYETSVYYMNLGNTEETLRRLQKYVDTVCAILDKGILHGDSYFYRLDDWFETLDLGTIMPRSKKLIVQSAMAALKNPVFQTLWEYPAFQRLERKLMNIIE